MMDLRDDLESVALHGIDRFEKNIKSSQVQPVAQK